jgi:hypothetical protein
LIIASTVSHKWDPKPSFTVDQTPLLPDDLTSR